MKIEVLYSPGCWSHFPTLDLIEDVLDELGLSASVEQVRVEDQATAERLHFVGSPTVRVDGVDLEPRATFSGKDFGLRCRLYSEDGKPRPRPSRRLIQELIEIAHLAEQGMLAGCC